MTLKGHWTLLSVSLVDFEIELRLSPLGVVPQRDRWPQTICDYSFCRVNDETADTAPGEAMQFEIALHQLLQRMHHANP